jgi:hypothetical protein
MWQLLVELVNQVQIRRAQSRIEGGQWMCDRVVQAHTLEELQRFSPFVMAELRQRVEL